MMLKNALLSAVLLAMSVTGALAALAMHFIMIEFMSPTEMGFALTIISSATLAATLPFLGLDAAVIKYVRKYSAQKQPADNATYLRFLQRIYWVNCAMLCLGGAAFSIWAWRNGQFALLVTWLPAIAAIPIFAWMRFRSQLANADGRVIGAAIGRSLIRRVALLMFMLAIVFVNAPLTVSAISFGYLFAILTAAVVQAMILPIYKFPKPQANFTSRDQKHWIKDGFALGINLLFLEYAIEIIIVTAAFVLDKTEIAVLGVALRLAGFCRFAVMAADQTYRPKIARAIAENQPNVATDLLRQAATTRVIFASITTTFAVILLPLFSRYIDDSFAMVPALVFVLLGDIFVFAILGSPQTVLGQSRFASILLPVSALSIIALVGAVLIAGWFGSLWLTAWSVTLVLVARIVVLYVVTIRTTGFDCSIFSLFPKRPANAT